MSRRNRRPAGTPSDTDAGPGAFQPLTRPAMLRGAGLLVAATVVAYVPAMRGGFIWDDDSYVTHNPVLRTANGLRRMWLEPKSIPQYYPLVHTTYWIEYRLWKLDPAGYHVVNVLLHAISALLLWLLLRRLAVPGALLAAGVFALHPVCVETVAWITERKNALSGVLYLLSMLAYLGFCGAGPRSGSRRRWGLYAVSVVCFVGALLSKTVTASLPAVLFVLLWWKRKRIDWRASLPLAPMLLLGAGMGLLTAHLERQHVGAQGAQWAFSVVERFLIAGRALWFYAYKVFWPRVLTFFYPRWKIDPTVWWQYLFPAGVVVVLAALWLLRKRIGRGPLAAVLIFAGTLFPALGFLNVYPMRYSFVADHFQYLACISLIALAVAAGARLLDRLGDRKRRVAIPAGAVLLVVLGVLTWRQGRGYRSEETLWLDNLRKNPDSFMAHNNYATILAARGDLEQAIAHCRQATRLKPDDPEPVANLGWVLTRAGRSDEAIAQYHNALAVDPGYAPAHFSLGNALRRKGQLDEAIHHYQMAVRLSPKHHKALNNLGVALERGGRIDEAILQYQQALRIKPDYAAAHFNLGRCLRLKNRTPEAIHHYSEALRLRPGRADVHLALAKAWAMSGRPERAARHLVEALRIEPDSPEALNDLAWIRATSSAPALRDGAEAVRLAERACQLTNHAAPGFLDTLAAGYARAGKFENAAEVAARAVSLASSSGRDQLAVRIGARLDLYKAGRPYVETLADRGTSRPADGGGGGRDQ